MYEKNDKTKNAIYMKAFTKQMNFVRCCFRKKINNISPYFPRTQNVCNFSETTPSQPASRTPPSLALGCPSRACVTKGEPPGTHFAARPNRTFAALG